ncbi:MAG: V-type H+-transporting ATPase subunit [Actinobacteria bacterium]|nr:MAG: V-type H+-transporting ATPase subunit [Actinomycetota bacterium]
MSVPLLKAVRDAQRYGFAVGKVRVLQTRIFGAGTYERLLDAPTFSEQMRVVSDTIYGRYLEDAKSADDVEDGLERALDDFYRFLDDANLPDAVVRFFRVRYDYANVRAILKARALGVSTEGMVVGLGTVSTEVVTGPVAGLPPFLGDIVWALTPVAGESWVGAEAIDATVEAALFADLVHTAHASKSSTLRELAALTVDVANARSAVRAHRRGVPAGVLAGMLHGGGAIKVADIEAAYELPFDEFIEVLAASRALKGVTADELAADGGLDVVLDNLVARFVRRVRVVPFGPEPVIAYVMAREAEVVAVRTLLIGRLAGLDREALRRRLRDLSV